MYRVVSLLLCVVSACGIRQSRLRNGTQAVSSEQGWAITNAEQIGIIHVGKCAGTSFDNWVTNHVQVPGRPIYGYRIHADMSYILARSTTARVFTWLREPGKRAASNILFWNTLSFTQTWACRHCSLSEIIRGGHLGSYAGAFSDGWGGTSWLAGTCPNGWYVHTSPDGSNGIEKARRQDLMTNNPGQVLRTAKQNLDSTAWFGLLEDVDKSMELLKWQIGKSWAGPLPHSNSNSNSRQHQVTEDDLNLLRKEIPLDVSLHEYARNAFETRWNAYQKVKSQPASDAGPIPIVGMYGATGSVSFYNSSHKFPRTDTLPFDEKLDDFVSGIDM